MKIIKYIYVDEDHKEPLGVESSPVCQKCGLPISHRFQLEDGSWVGSECAEHEETAAKKLIRNKKKFEDAKKHIGSMVMVKYGFRTYKVRLMSLSLKISGDILCKIRWNKNDTAGQWFPRSDVKFI